MVETHSTLLPTMVADALASFVLSQLRVEFLEFSHHNSEWSSWSSRVTIPIEFLEFSLHGNVLSA